MPAAMHSHSTYLAHPKVTGAHCADFIRAARVYVAARHFGFIFSHASTYLHSGAHSQLLRSVVLHQQPYAHSLDYANN